MPVRNPTFLRPLGRRPMLLQRYRCRICKTNWLYESDPLNPEELEWICLYQASNILNIVSVLHPRSRSGVPTAKAPQAEVAGTLQSELIGHRFSGWRSPTIRSMGSAQVCGRETPTPVIAWAALSRQAESGRTATTCIPPMLHLVVTSNRASVARCARQRWITTSKRKICL